MFARRRYIFRFRLPHVDAVAHVRLLADGEPSWHRLAEHLEAVATMAAAFAEPFGGSDWARYIGMMHDLGKYHPEWQSYLRRQVLPEAHLESSKRPRHSGVGAIAALECFNHAAPARILAYCIAGHHSGLADWYPDLEHRLMIEQRERALYREVCKVPQAQPILCSQPPHTKPSPWENGREQLHLWVRMLFSCLVDADVLDTERFMQPDVAAQRGNYPSLDELRARYNAFIEQLERSVHQTPLNKLRRQIRLQCIGAAAHPRGFFSLVVPTGGGKTLASIGFALEHAVRHGLRRVIVAIPYTSIIEQTAAVLRYGTDTPSPGMQLFGSEAIVEHHSNLDPDEETLRSRLATENWDAPIIVTTTVQLFESLFGCRPSQLRKLHNIAQSVIILDEAQLLPAEHLRPLLSVLQGLVDYFGCTVLLMTATLPVLEGTIGSPPAVLQGISGVRAIIENPRELAQKLDRVEVVIDRARGDRLTWEELARELEGYEQVLCIVNSRKDCRDLHQLMPPGTFHLSSLQCGQERSRIIQQVKEQLRRGEPVHLVSTQLVEAGVDIDFPVVYRALAGLDSIAQAAGRCNREQRLQRKGKVVVFTPPTHVPAGVLRKAADTTAELLRTRGDLRLDPEFYADYFAAYYRRINTFDAANFQERLVNGAGEFSFAFRSFADAFRIVDDRVRESVVVWYTDPVTGTDSRALIEDIRRGRDTYRTWRMLQRYVV
ncbi:MAG: CRISPR-associated helicase Cas3', partial [Chlorobiota bacterium]